VEAAAEPVVEVAADQVVKVSVAQTQIYIF
jgi:hypothetical protein